MEPEDFGPAEAWQIREFPRRLRDYIANEARNQDVKVGELLTKIVVAYRDGRLGHPSTMFANPLNGTPDLTELLELERLSHLARLLTSEGKSSKPLAEAKRLVWARLKALTNKWEAHEGEDSEAPRALAAPTT